MSRNSKDSADRIADILSGKMPGLTEKACKSIEALLDSGDPDQIRTALGAYTKTLPFLVAQQSKTVIELSGGVDSESFDAINEFLKQKRK